MTAAVTVATIAEFFSASRNSNDEKTSRYQRREKPLERERERPGLVEGEEHHDDEGYEEEHERESENRRRERAPLRRRRRSHLDEANAVELEDPEAGRGQEEAEHERRQHQERHRSPEREVAEARQRLLDATAQHGTARASEELRRHVVGRREHEDEEKRRDRRRRDQGQHDPAPARDDAAAEILRALEQRGRDRSEARVEDEHDVGQEDVDERDGDGEAVEEQEAERAVDEAELPQPRVQQPVLAEDRSPRVDADEVAREQRRRDQEQDGRLRPAGAVAQPVGDRQREKHGDGGRAEPDVEGVEGERPVDARGHDVLVVLERGRSADREESRRQEAVDEERDERRDEQHEQADDGRQAQGNRPQPELAVPPGGPRSLLVRDRGHVEPATTARCLLDHAALALSSCHRSCHCPIVTYSSDSTGGLL